MDLYSYISPPGANIPISVEPFLVDDSVATEDEIEWAVERLQNHCSGGTSVMRDKHLKGWIASASKKEKEEAAIGEDMKESSRGGGDLQNIRRHPTGRWWWNLCRRRSGRGNWRRRPRGRQWS